MPHAKVATAQRSDFTTAPFIILHSSFLLRPINLPVEICAQFINLTDRIGYHARKRADLLWSLHVLGEQRVDQFRMSCLRSLRTFARHSPFRRRPGIDRPGLSLRRRLGDCGNRSLISDGLLRRSVRSSPQPFDLCVRRGLRVRRLLFRPDPAAPATGCTFMQ